MNKKEIYLSIILFSLAFVILLVTLYPHRPQFSKNIDSYTCPTTEWINCMPGPDLSETECHPKYIDWAEVNCSNFKGVVY